jgi:hypothetical protein
MAYEHMEIQLSLASAVKALKAGSHALEKLAHVVTKDDLDKTIALCGLEKKAQEDRVFTEKELRQAREVYGLFKIATAAVAEKKQLTDFVNRAEQVLFHKTANVEKLAGFGTAVGNGVLYLVVLLDWQGPQFPLLSVLPPKVLDLRLIMWVPSVELQPLEDILHPKTA